MRIITFDRITVPGPTHHDAAQQGQRPLAEPGSATLGRAIIDCARRAADIHQRKARHARTEDATQ